MGRQPYHIYQKTTGHIDWVIIVSLVLLGFIGLFVLLTTNTGLFWQQFAFLVVGFGLIFVLSHLDSVLLWWFAPYGYILSILLLIASYFGTPIRGATRWIIVAGVQLQPSELVKPFIILAFARAITMFSPRKFRWVLLHGALFLLPFLLVFRQPDLGTALVFAFSWLSMMVAGGFSVLLLAVAATLLALGFPFLWHVLAPYQRGRILTFLNPQLDPRGAGYNALQAMIAVGSGQFFGRGLGRGTQSHLRFLPEYHTDFIFATLIEELGFFGGIVLLLLYASLLWQLVQPYVKGVMGNPFSFFYTIGLFSVLLTQVVINTGMNMGIIPVTGITLPFVSYGGSSILSLCMAFGMLVALRRSEINEGSIAIS